MKRVYSLSELRRQIHNGQAVRFTRPVSVQVIAANKPISGTMQVTFEILCGQDSIGEFITEIESMEMLLQAFRIADHDETLELLEFLSDE